jgi:hypothetical protein
VDKHGLPAWSIVDGKPGDGSHAQVLRIPKGEKPPEVEGL